MRTMIRNVSLVAVVVAGALAGTASPATAATTGCKIPVNRTWCTTGSIPASSQHQILLTAISGTEARVTCDAIDSVTGTTVGSVTSPLWASSDKRISGLYGRYFINCHGGRGSNGGGGSLSNG